MNALMYATRCSSLAAVKLIIDQGINIQYSYDLTHEYVFTDRASREQEPVLAMNAMTHAFFSTHSDKVQIISYLSRQIYSCTLPFSMNIIYLACKYGTYADVRRIYDINPRILIQTKQVYSTLLYYAVQNPSLDDAIQMVEWIFTFIPVLPTTPALSAALSAALSQDGSVHTGPGHQTPRSGSIRRGSRYKPLTTTEEERGEKHNFSDHTFSSLDYIVRHNKYELCELFIKLNVDINIYVGPDSKYRPLVVLIFENMWETDNYIARIGYINPSPRQNSPTNPPQNQVQDGIADIDPGNNHHREVTPITNRDQQQHLQFLIQKYGLDHQVISSTGTDSRSSQGNIPPRIQALPVLPQLQTNDTCVKMFRLFLKNKANIHEVYYKYKGYVELRPGNTTPLGHLIEFSCDTKMLDVITEVNPNLLHYLYQRKPCPIHVLASAKPVALGCSVNPHEQDVVVLNPIPPLKMSHSTHHTPQLNTTTSTTSTAGSHAAHHNALHNHPLELNTSTTSSVASQGAGEYAHQHHLTTTTTTTTTTTQGENMPPHFHLDTASQTSHPHHIQLHDDTTTPLMTPRASFAATHISTSTTTTTGSNMTNFTVRTAIGGDAVDIRRPVLLPQGEINVDGLFMSSGNNTPGGDGLSTTAFAAASRPASPQLAGNTPYQRPMVQRRGSVNSLGLPAGAADDHHTLSHYLTPNTTTTTTTTTSGLAVETWLPSYFGATQTRATRHSQQCICEYKRVLYGKLVDTSIPSSDLGPSHPQSEYHGNINATSNEYQHQQPSSQQFIRRRLSITSMQADQTYHQTTGSNGAGHGTQSVLATTPAAAAAATPVNTTTTTRTISGATQTSITSIRDYQTSSTPSTPRRGPGENYGMQSLRPTSRGALNSYTPSNHSDGQHQTPMVVAQSPPSDRLSGMSSASSLLLPPPVIPTLSPAIAPTTSTITSGGHDGIPTPVIAPSPSLHSSTTSLGIAAAHGHAGAESSRLSGGEFELHIPPGMATRPASLSVGARTSQHIVRSHMPYRDARGVNCLSSSYYEQLDPRHINILWSKVAYNVYASLSSFQHNSGPSPWHTSKPTPPTTTTTTTTTTTITSSQLEEQVPWTVYPQSTPTCTPMLHWLFKNQVPYSQRNIETMVKVCVRRGDITALVYISNQVASNLSGQPWAKKICGSTQILLEMVKIKDYTDFSAVLEFFCEKGWRPNCNLLALSPTGVPFQDEVMMAYIELIVGSIRSGIVFPSPTFLSLSQQFYLNRRLYDLPLNLNQFTAHRYLNYYVLQQVLRDCAHEPSASHSGTSDGKNDIRKLTSHYQTRIKAKHKQAIRNTIDSLMSLRLSQDTPQPHCLPIKSSRPTIHNHSYLSTSRSGFCSGSVLCSDAVCYCDYPTEIARRNEIIYSLIYGRIPTVGGKQATTSITSQSAGTRYQQTTELALPLEPDLDASDSFAVCDDTRFELFLQLIAQWDDYHVYKLNTYRQTHQRRHELHQRAFRHSVLSLPESAVVSQASSVFYPSANLSSRQGPSVPLKGSHSLASPTSLTSPQQICWIESAREWASPTQLSSLSDVNTAKLTHLLFKNINPFDPLKLDSPFVQRNIGIMVPSYSKTAHSTGSSHHANHHSNSVLEDIEANKEKLLLQAIRCHCSAQVLSILINMGYNPQKQFALCGSRTLMDLLIDSCNVDALHYLVLSRRQQFFYSAPLRCIYNCFSPYENKLIYAEHLELQRSYILTLNESENTQQQQYQHLQAINYEITHGVSPIHTPTDQPYLNSQFVPPLVRRFEYPIVKDVAFIKINPIIWLFSTLVTHKKAPLQRFDDNTQLFSCISAIEVYKFINLCGEVLFQSSVEYSDNMTAYWASSPQVKGINAAVEALSSQQQQQQGQLTPTLMAVYPASSHSPVTSSPILHPTNKSSAEHGSPAASPMLTSAPIPSATTISSGANSTKSNPSLQKKSKSNHKASQATAPKWDFHNDPALYIDFGQKDSNGMTILMLAVIAGTDIDNHMLNQGLAACVEKHRSPQNTMLLDQIEHQVKSVRPSNLFSRNKDIINCYCSPNSYCCNKMLYNQYDNDFLVKMICNTIVRYHIPVYLDGVDYPSPITWYQSSLSSASRSLVSKSSIPAVASPTSTPASTRRPVDRIETKVLEPVSNSQSMISRQIQSTATQPNPRTNMEYYWNRKQKYNEMRQRQHGGKCEIM